MGAGISDRRKSVRADGYEEISGEPSGDVITHSDDEVPLSDDDSSSFGSSLEITEERTDLSLSRDVFQSDPATSDEKGECVSGLTSYKQMTHQVSRAARASILGRPRKKRSVVLPTGEAVVITDGRTLNTLFGVFMPCVLAMFSLVLFLRVGTAVGQCGIYQSVALLCLGYFIILMTTLSICAISTNGEVEAGGAYFMISRTLGPEFGGALGLLLFISNVLSSATYIMSVTEAIIDSFGDHSGTLEKTLPEEYAYQLLYSFLVLVFCSIICAVGGSLYAKSTFIIFIVVNAIILCVIINFFIGSEKPIILPSESQKLFHEQTANFTGLSIHTFEENDEPHYSEDYTTKEVYNFISVFGIVFNGCTGILAGANLSGELKNPAKSIPKGTLLAEAYTFTIYALLYILVAFTCSTDLLQMNYTFLQPINFYPPLVFVGTILVTTSAALSAFLGASRILFAVSKDKILGVLLAPFAKYATSTGNPYLCVAFTAFLIQLVLFVNNVNDIAPMVSIFFLMVYFFINVACALLDIASAPNFRPSFKYFSWHVSVVGMIGCLTMIFIISPLYAFVNLLILVVLIIVISIVGPPTVWGSITQGLTFYLVRKFLLKLDSRKDHVKFWRPQILLLVNNPKSCMPLLKFTNDLKKSGLYVIGHVLQNRWAKIDQDPVPETTEQWMVLIEYLHLKAFVEMTVTESIRDGILSLARLSGLGGMKPNTVILGFYDYVMPVDTFNTFRESGSLSVSTRAKLLVQSTTSVSSAKKLKHKFQTTLSELPEVRAQDDDRVFNLIDYVRVIDDLIKMNKNVCLARNFNCLDERKLTDNKSSRYTLYIDVWLVDFLNPGSHFTTEVPSFFMLQLACILKMKGVWKSNAKLRVFVSCRDRLKEQAILTMRSLLDKLRISAEVVHIDWEDIAEPFTILSTTIEETSMTLSHEAPASMASTRSNLPVTYFENSNRVLRQHCSNSIMLFLYLPKPPPEVYKPSDNVSGSSSMENTREVQITCEKYMENLEILTKRLPPSLLVHGVSVVTCTGF